MRIESGIGALCLRVSAGVPNPLPPCWMCFPATVGNARQTHGIQPTLRGGSGRSAASSHASGGYRIRSPHPPAAPLVLGNSIRSNSLHRSKSKRGSFPGHSNRWGGFLRARSLRGLSPAVTCMSLSRLSAERCLTPAFEQVFEGKQNEAGQDQRIEDTDGADDPKSAQGRVFREQQGGETDAGRQRR